MAKFYDNVSLNFLARAAKELGYPARMLLLGLEAALGGRRLKMGQLVSSSDIHPGNGILAGDGQATSFARAFLWPVLAYVKKRVPEITLRQFVDDLRIRATGTKNEAPKSCSEGPLSPQRQTIGHQVCAVAP